MDLFLKDRVAVVTGAGNGIGRAEAITLAARGARVVVNDIGTAWDGIGTSRAPADLVVKQIQDAGGTAVACYHSVAEEESAQKIIRTAIDVFGRIDILVNNAGVVRDPVNVSEIRSEDWEIILKTHLFGTFYTTRYACGFMRKQGSGRIINTSSHVGLGWKGFTSYAAAKEGIVGLTRTVARDMVEYNVGCNAIRPIAAWRGTKEMQPHMLVNQPQDVANLVVFLASDKAAHINGCIFEVWHGHVGIFEDPPAVEKVIRKDGAWTLDELAEMVPQRLTAGRSIDDFPPVLDLKGVG